MLRKGFILFMAVSIAFAFSIVGEEKNEERGIFHILIGYAYYNNTENVASFAIVNITNVDRWEWNLTTTDAAGFYTFNCGSFQGPGWEPGENITITVYGNSSQCWSNWTGSVNGTVPSIAQWYNVTLESTIGFYDVGTKAINYPSNNSILCPTPISYRVNATIKNYGNLSHSFPVELRIYDNNNSLKFSDIEMISLAPMEEKYVEFDAWAPPDMTMNYTIVVTTNMTCPNHDYMPWTDSKSITVHVLQRIIDMEVEKKVWNESSLTWDDEVDIQDLPCTVRFNISIHNNGTCSSLTNISITDILNGMQYEYNSTFINGIHAPDPYIVGNMLIWNESILGYEWPNVLESCNYIYIIYNATISNWGEKINNVSVNAVAYPTWENVTKNDFAHVIVKANVDEIFITFEDLKCIENETISTNFTFNVHAAAYNYTYGFIGLVNASWSIANNGSNASINASYGKEIEFNSGWKDGIAILHASYDNKSDSVTFTINSSLFTFLLHQGWNFITVPCQNSFNASTLYSSIENCKIVLKWNASEQLFGVYIPGCPYDFNIEDGIGYFIAVINTTIFSIADIPITSVNVTLYEGWNTLGWFKENVTHASSLHGNISNCTAVLILNASKQNFDLYVPGSPYDFAIMRGEGFLVAVNKQSHWHGEG